MAEPKIKNVQNDKTCKEINDRTTANMFVKVAQSTAVGLVCSLLISLKSKKFRKFPILLGAGYGVGQGITERRFIYSTFQYEHGDEMFENFFKNNSLRQKWRENEYVVKYLTKK